MANALTSSMINKYKNESYGQKNNNNFFDTKFSEKDVLELQAMFLTFGIHVIKTKNVHSGRVIMETILGSLKYFKNIGAVTYVSSLPNFACDILEYIKIQGFVSDDMIPDLENFFTMHSCFDFIWVEFTGALYIEYFDGIKNIFETYHVQDQMPIIFVMYENE